MKTVVSSSFSKSEKRVSSLVSEILEPYKATIKDKKLHDIMMEAGKRIAYEIENLDEDKELMKDECVLLKRMNAKVECEKSNYEIELRGSLKECQELKERLARSKNDKFASELQGQIDMMKRQLLERDDCIRGYRQRVSFLEKKVVDTENELKVSKDEKLASDGILEEMRVKETEANLTIEELRRENLESSDKIGSYRQKLSFSNKKVVDIQKELKDQKSMSDGIVDGMRLKEIEANSTVEELRRTYVKKSSEIEKEFRSEMLAADLEKSRLEGIIEEMKRKEFDAGQTTEELRRQYLGAFDDAVVLRNRLLVSEADKLRVEEELKDLKDQKLKLDGVLEETRLKQKESENKMEELRRINLESEAHQTAEELRTRNLKACEEILGLRNRIEEEKTRYEADIVGLRNHILRLEEDKRESERKQMEAVQVNLEAIDELKRIIVKTSQETKEAKANTSFFSGDKHNLESGSSLSTERASTVLQQLETIDSPKEAIPGAATSNSDIRPNLGEPEFAHDAETIDNPKEAIPGAATSNSDTRPNLGAPEKIPECPSSPQSGFPNIPVPKRKRSPRSNGEDNSRQRKKQVPIPVVVLDLPAHNCGDLDSGFAQKGSSSISKPVTHKRDLSLPADMLGNLDSGFARNESSSKSKVVTPERDVSRTADISGNPTAGFARNSNPVSVRDSQSELLESDSESSSGSDYSDSRMEEMVREVRETSRKTRQATPDAS